MPKLPAPPVDVVAFQVDDVDWEDLAHRLNYLIGHPVEVRFGLHQGEQDLFDVGGVLDVISRPISSEDEEVHLYIEGADASVKIRRQDVVEAQASVGYVGIELADRYYLTISYYSRLSSIDRGLHMGTKSACSMPF